MEPPEVGTEVKVPGFGTGVVFKRGELVEGTRDKVWGPMFRGVVQVETPGDTLDAITLNYYKLHLNDVEEED